MLEHTMRKYERILEKRLRNRVDIDNYQFDFRPGRSITDAIFLIRQLQQMVNKKKQKLHHLFVDLERAFDRVLRKYTK